MCSQRLEPLRNAAFVALGAVAAFAPRTAHAGNCPLLVRPEPADPYWGRAATEAQAAVTQSPGDCASAVIDVDGQAARLTFVTTDGRQAVRTLHDPTELAPTLQALMTPLPPIVREDASPIHGTSIENDRPPAPPMGHLLALALVGGRFAGPDVLLSPTLHVGVSFALEKWELGVIGDAAPFYADLDTDDAVHPWRLSSVGAGVAAGRRIRVNERVSLLAGVDLSAAILHEEWHEQNSSNTKPNAVKLSSAFTWAPCIPPVATRGSARP
jgi:hypothetical protein